MAGAPSTQLGLWLCLLPPFYIKGRIVRFSEMLLCFLTFYLNRKKGCTGKRSETNGQSTVYNKKKEQTAFKSECFKLEAEQTY